MGMAPNDFVKVPGFNIIEEIYRTSQSVLFRALRESNTSQVVLKTVPARLASQETTAHLRREFLVARDLQDSPFIAKPLELVQNGDLTALVLEDFGATSLQAYLRGGRLGLHDVLRIGIAVASALDHVHAGGLLHLDVKPANVLVSANLAIIKLTDFSISSLLPERNQGPISPEALRGTAAYISPEQTGRMNRTIDSRTDLYALGVTLYELLTGTRPFYSEELQHLLYQHLAVVPVAPCKRDSAVPHIVSDIVMKCLLKDAANRYQTASGLKTDLQTCLDQLVKNGEIAPIPLGRADQRGQLRAPEHVLGREHEIQLLFHCHKRVVERESMEVILISGYSGIGKTSLVGELQRAHATGKEAFVQGKFDQYSHDTPFKPLISAMQSLLRQVLCEPAATINVWKEKVQAALGRNGRLMTDVLPGLGHLIGPQPELPPVEATAAQNRFSDTFVRLIRTCAQLRSPLVLFLDDLQWSDGPSLRLLEALVKDGQSLPLLLIGAYRDVEVDESHALMRLVTSLKKGDVPLLQMHLGPLKLQDTTALVATCLGLEKRGATNGEPLGEWGQLVQDKTEGNPFYSLQFLRSLVKDKLLQFDKDTGECRWGNMAHLRDKAHVTMNVVEFMANELRTRLPPRTLEVLSLASCIDNIFSLRDLTLVCQEPSGELVSRLWPALTSGFIFLVGEEWQDTMEEDAAMLSTVRFQFRHDRIRQAAYQEVDPVQRPELHLQVGRQLMAGLSAAQYEDNQYSILHHFNEAIQLITDTAEQLKLAKANMAAGAKAKGSTAYEVALRHASCAKTLLGDKKAWEDHPDLMLQIATEEAECLSLVGKHEEALALLSELRNRVQDDDGGSLRIAEMWVNALTLAGQLAQSMDAALEALASLGTPFPTAELDLEEAIAAEQPRVESRLAATDVASLPETSDPKSLALLRLMDRVIVGGYSTGQVKLIHLLSVRMVAAVLDSGRSPPGCVALILYAIFFNVRLKRYEQGDALGKTGMAILEQMQDQSKRGQVLLTFSSAVAHWVRSMQECTLMFEDGLVSALDHGDHVYAAYNVSQIVLYNFFASTPLQEVKEKAASSQRALHRIGDTSQRAITTAVYHATRVLMADVPSWASRESGGEIPWDEAAYVKENEANTLGLQLYYVVKIATLCLLSEYREADAVLSSMGPGRAVLQVTIFSVILMYYEAVICSQLLQADADAAPNGKTCDVADLGSRLNECVLALEEYADTNPDSHLHRYYLARAEQERWKGNNAAAEHYYALAIDAAEENRFVQDAALAYLLASRHWSAVGRARLAAWHLSEVQDAFASWGATLVLHRLPTPQPFLRPGRRRIVDESAMNSSHSLDQHLDGTTLDTLKLDSFSEQSMDIRAVLAASQTLSSAIVREALLEKLLGIVLETAGARYVVLVLRRPGDEGGWYVEGSANVQVRAPLPDMGPPSPRLDELSLEDEDTSPVDTVTRVAPAGQVLPLGEAGAVVPQALVTYVTRTQEVVLGGAELGAAYKDAYLEKKKPRSALCMPIVRHGESCGVLYVEHELLPDAFPASRIKILAMLSSQIAISIENSALYEQMQSRQNELIAAKNAAEEATRAKSLFLATMSHEIRTPLNAIIGMTSMLMGLDLSPEKQECVETIRQSGDQLLAVISDVLDFSKIEAGTLELEAAPFSIRQCLEEAADLVAARAADKGLQLATHTHATIPPTIIGDVSRLRQVLVNLLSNAVKFTDKGEVILQATAVSTRGKSVKVEFTCRDTGIGIAPEHIPRLFAAFSQADASTTRKFGGTGLGLAISDRLVKAMGGRFRVESMPGTGSTFRFTVQVEAVSDHLGSEPDVTTLQDLRGRRCLLLVNTPSIHAILEQQLTVWGVKCMHAPTVAAAAQHLQKEGTPPFDIAIADKCPVLNQQVPDITTCPVAAIAPLLPLVVLCSWTDWETRVAQSLGPLRLVISKPVKLGHLWDALTKLLPGRQSAQALSLSGSSSLDVSAVEKPVTANPVIRSSLRILLTEDNPVNQRVAQMLLKRLGYRADCVADGIECIRSLESRPYDVVLMDLSMPVMDGLQASRVICSRWPKGKRPYLVAVTANAMEGDRDRCLAAGMDDYISKPVRINELQKVLDAQALKTYHQLLDSPQGVLDLLPDAE